MAMGGLPKPTLPDGPAQVLFDQLHRLHHRAGWPSLRDMAREVGCSHTTVSAAFSEPKVPRWGLLELIVETLGGDTDEFHEHWLAAGRTALGPQPSLAPAITVTAPHELPADVSGFTGREAQLAELDELLTAAPSSALRIATISGTPGVGKTALAVHWAHRAAARFPDGQLYLNLRGYDPEQPVQPVDALEWFLRELGVEPGAIPRDVTQRAARYRTLLASRRMLVLLDNVESVEQVRELLPGDSSCVVVVTSRAALPALVARHGARRINLDLLPADDSLTLLGLLIGERVTAEPNAANALAERSAHLPLALRIVAELALARPGTSLNNLVGELDEEAQRLDLFAAGEDEHTAMRTVFSWSQRQLDDDTQRAFALLGMHPGTDLDLATAAALFAVEARTARRLLDNLARVNLIDVDRARRFGMHDLLRAYACELAQDRPDRSAALDRLFEHYLRTARAGPETAWFDAERTNLIAVAQAAADDSPLHTIGLADAAAHYLDAHAYYDDALALDQAALAAAERSGDRASEALVLNLLGTAERRFGRYGEAEALHQRALALHRRLHNPAGEARSLHGLGILAWRAGRYLEATERLTQALRIFSDTGDQLGRAQTLYVLGVVKLRLGQHADALRDQQEALQIYRQLSQRTGEGRALNNLGEVLLRVGRLEEAAQSYQASLDIAREQGNRTGEGVALINLATVEQRYGRLDHALETLGHALTICRRVGYRIGETEAIRGIGVTYHLLGSHDEAIPHLEEAVALGREIGEVGVQTSALNDLGDALIAAGRTGNASAAYQAALGTAESTGDEYEQARAHAGLAALARTDWPDDAREHRQHALDSFDTLGLAEADEMRSQLQS
jgi:tetratricopeptide (TPR) repeat protein